MTDDAEAQGARNAASGAPPDVTGRWEGMWWFDELPEPEQVLRQEGIVPGHVTIAVQDGRTFRGEMVAESRGEAIWRYRIRGNVSPDGSTEIHLTENRQDDVEIVGPGPAITGRFTGIVLELTMPNVRTEEGSSASRSAPVHFGGLRTER